MNKETENFVAESIKAKYETKNTTELDQLKSLDRKVTRGADIFGYTYGSLSALVFGTGMCFALGAISLGSATASMILGCVLGVVGAALMTSTHFIYRAIVRKNKKKYGKQIIDLSNQILNK